LQKICLIVALHQPIYLSRNFPYERAKRIADEASLMDRYFDYGLCHKLYLENSKQIFTPLLTGFLEEAEATAKTPNPFRFAIAASGLFIEQVVKEDAFLLSVIKKLLGLGAVEFVATPYHNSLASLYSGGLDEFEEQVKEDVNLLGKMFSVQPKVFSNTKLVFNDRIARSVEAMGFVGNFVDGVKALNAESPAFTYTSSAAPGLRLLVRDTKLSTALISGAIEEVERLKTGDGLAVIYFDTDEIGKRDKSYYKLIAGTLHQQGFSFVSPTEYVMDTTPAGSLSVPEPLTIATEEAGGNVNRFLANPMQRISYDRVSALRPYIKEVGDERVKVLWRILQQLDHFIYMGDQMPPAIHKIFSGPAETFAVYNTILVDFEGKITTIVQRMRKARSPAVPKPGAPPVGYRTPAQMLDRGNPASPTGAPSPYDKKPVS
jgi:alpha-amylase